MISHSGRSKSTSREDKYEMKIGVMPLLFYINGADLWVK
jgi:hypothetical protein